MIWFLLTLPAMVAWMGLLMTPWRSWGTKECLNADTQTINDYDLSDVTVVIPARNESAVLGYTLAALVRQGEALNVIVVDDNSTDGTENIASNFSGLNLRVITGTALADGWSGKLWALEQGFREVRTPLMVLLDADISLSDTMLFSMRKKMYGLEVDFLSVLAELRMQCFWERLLMPAYVYFFKLLYPFSLSNRPTSKVAAAAGGCVMLKRSVLQDIGGFSSLRCALIDDCTLAARIKSTGAKTWMGLTHDAKSLRPYDSLASIWRLVSRSAFTQLRYSGVLLIFLTLVFVFLFIIPFFAVASLQSIPFLMGMLALIGLYVCYLPTLKFYNINLLYTLLLPVVAMLFLAMTWSSAFSHWFGQGARWKGRHYGDLGSEAVQPGKAKLS